MCVQASETETGRLSESPQAARAEFLYLGPYKRLFPASNCAYTSLTLFSQVFHLRPSQLCGAVSVCLVGQCAHTCSFTCIKKQHFFPKKNLLQFLKFFLLFVCFFDLPVRFMLRDEQKMSFSRLCEAFETSAHLWGFTAINSWLPFPFILMGLCAWAVCACGSWENEKTYEHTPCNTDIHTY